MDFDRSGRAAPGAIAVFAFPRIGDFVRCHSLIRLLASRHPGRPIDVIGRAPAIALAAFMTEVHVSVAENFRHGRLDLPNRMALADQLRARNYQTAYVLQGSFKSALVPFLAGIPERIGWLDEFQFPLINRPRFHSKRLPRMVDLTCWLAVHPTHAPPSCTPASWPHPNFEVPPHLQSDFRALVQEARRAAPVIVLAPGSSSLRKNWAIENFARLATDCTANGYTVWVTGSCEESAMADAIGRRARIENRTTTSVQTLALTIAAGDVFVGNDSGPLHIAAAFNKPSIGLFGLTSSWQNAPINASVRLADAALDVPRRTRSDVCWPTPDQVIQLVGHEVQNLGLRPAPRTVAPPPKKAI